MPNSSASDAFALTLTVECSTYGKGTPSTTGRVPGIKATLARRGDACAVHFGLIGAPGHAPAVLLVGRARAQQRAHGIDIAIDLSQPFAEFFASTDGFGEALLETPLPPHNLEGQFVVAQWFVRDAGASGLGFAASRGLEVRLVGR